MLGYYVECDTAACGGISKGPTRPGPVRQKDKPAINGVVKRLYLKHNFTTRAVEHCEHWSNSAAQVVQQSTSLTYGYTPHSETAGWNFIIWSRPL